jgi:hypothetical protein
MVMNESPFLSPICEANFSIPMKVLASQEMKLLRNEGSCFARCEVAGFARN